VPSFAVALLGKIEVLKDCRDLLIEEMGCDVM
jgi:hypothetical protein